MKKVLILLFVLCVGSSCKKSDIPQKTEQEEVLDSIEKVNVIIPENLNIPTEPQGDPTYNVIGYGYDATGILNDASSIRGQVVNIAAYVEGEKKHDSLIPSRTTSFWYDSFDANNAEVLIKKLSAKSDAIKGKSLYAGTISESFPKTNASSEKYVYGYYSLYLQYKSFRFFINDDLVAKFRKYLSPSFESDVQTLSPELMIKKYGTHLLVEIALGAKLDILYQAEPSGEDRSDLQKSGYDAAVRTTFGFWTPTSSFSKIDSAKLRKIKSPALSFRVAGGDPSKIHVIKSTQGLRINTTDWLKSAETQNHVFIKTMSTIPLYSLIENENRRSELQAYIATYLENKEFKLTK